MLAICLEATGSNLIAMASNLRSCFLRLTQQVRTICHARLKNRMPSKLNRWKDQLKGLNFAGSCVSEPVAISEKLPHTNWTANWASAHFPTSNVADMRPFWMHSTKSMFGDSTWQSRSAQFNHLAVEVLRSQWWKSECCYRNIPNSNLNNHCFTFSTLAFLFRQLFSEIIQGAVFWIRIASACVEAGLGQNAADWAAVLSPSVRPIFCPVAGHPFFIRFSRPMLKTIRILCWTKDRIQ